MKKLILITLILAAVCIVAGSYPERSEEKTPIVICTPQPTPEPMPAKEETVPVKTQPAADPPESAPEPEEAQANRRTAWMRDAREDPAWCEYGGESFAEIMYRLTGQYGLSVSAACGIAANMRYESGWEPQRIAYDGSGSYGLCQWLGGRCSSFWWWCEQNDYDGTSVEGQLAYMMHELKSYPGVELEDDAYNTAYTFCVFYEAPEDTYGQARLRAQYAAELEGMFA